MFKYFLFFVFFIFVGCTSDIKSPTVVLSDNREKLNLKLTILPPYQSCIWREWSEEISNKSSLLPSGYIRYICGIVTLSSDSVSSLQKQYQWKKFTATKPLENLPCDLDFSGEWLYSDDFQKTFSQKTAYNVGIFLLSPESKMAFFCLHTL